MKRIIVGILASLGFLTLLLFIGAGAVLWVFWPGDDELPERMILTMDLRHGLGEATSSGSLAGLDLTTDLTLTETVMAIDRAGRHPNVAGLIVRIDGGSLGFAQTQEIRDAIAGFRDGGKFALAFSTSFGEFGPGTVGYYLAAAFDEIHLQPLGAVGLTGLYLETPLLQGLFEQIGVQPSGDKRGPYKTAANMFTERSLTREHQQSLEWLATSLHEQIRAGIADGRQLEPAMVDDLIDGGPYGANEALQKGLVDRLSYWDQVVQYAKDKAGSDARLLGHDAFADLLSEEEQAGDVVAMVEGVGQIQQGDSNDGPAGSVMGADTVSMAIADAIDDDEVRAILFRVDSGGGSAVASETIAREIRRAIEMKKPVIVSMGNVAASGGYWIAMDATAIVADPGTLTGSIGVLAGKPVLNELWTKLGVNWGTVGRGANASMWSTSSDYSNLGRERLSAFLDETYDAFTQGVARGRGMAQEDVHAVAEGRVWTGAQAQELGLVDELGGFAKALELVRAEIGADPDQAITLRRFPEPKPPWEAALDLIKNPLITIQILSDWIALINPATLSTPPVLIR